MCVCVCGETPAFKPVKGHGEGEYSNPPSPVQSSPATMQQPSPAAMLNGHNAAEPSRA